MTALDDGQEWYERGDIVTLGGYLPDDDENPGFDLAVNPTKYDPGTTHDSWICWLDMVPALQERLRNGNE
jgi:hypothetical protein